MEKEDISALLGIVLLVWVAIDFLWYNNPYKTYVPRLIIGLAPIFINYKIRKDRKQCLECAETLFLENFGEKADKVEVIGRSMSKHDSLLHGIFDGSAQVKFWFKGEVHKGIVDTKKRFLYMKEPILMPIYAGEVVPVWKDVTQMHGNRMPKKVEFYDSTELLHRVDILDEKGTLLNGSWRRREDIVEYWNPKKQVWEPIP
jgi:hypothetical protein